MKAIIYQNDKRNTDRVIDLATMIKKKKHEREDELREKIIEKIIESAEKLGW